MKKYVTFILLYLILSVQSTVSQHVNHWETAIFNNDTWKYVVGNAEPDANWRKLDFDENQWLTNRGGFGYGDNDDNTVIQTYIPSVYLRYKFEVPDTSKISYGLLQMDFDDDFVAYINDVEIARYGIGAVGDHPAYNSFGDNHEATMYSGGIPENFLIDKKKLKSFLKQGSNVLAIQVHNSSETSSDLSSNAFLSFAISDNSKFFRATPGWFVAPDLTTADFSSNLPIVSISTNGAEIKDDPKITADMKIIYHNNLSINKITDEGNVYNGKIGIEIRGAYSSSLPQKPFGLETRDETGNNLDVSLLDMPAENDWVLLANYNDKVYMRNTLAFDLFQKMGHYAPRMKHCEVILNDQYQGIYLFGERIKQSKKARVDISKLTMQDIDGDNITGGYIFKTDYDDGYGSYWESRYSPLYRAGEIVRFVYHDPESDELLGIQKLYIKNYVDQVESVLYSANFADPVSGYRNYIDVNSFIDYFIIGEISRNVDAYKKSRFFYKNKDSKDKKIYSGPVWDYDWAWKNLNDCESLRNTTGEGWVYKTGYECRTYPVSPSWEVRMLQDPTFANAINSRYFSLRKTILSQASLNHYIDSVANLLKDAQIRHENKWRTLGFNVGASEIDNQPATFEGDISKFKNWIATRLAWLDSNMVGKKIDDPSAEVVEIELYPNPVQNELFIKTSKSISNIKLFNSLGQQIMYMQPNRNIKSINLNHLIKGVYIIYITTDDGTISKKKIIKE